MRPVGYQEWIDDLESAYKCPAGPVSANVVWRPILYFPIEREACVGLHHRVPGVGANWIGDELFLPGSVPTKVLSVRHSFVCLFSTPVDTSNGSQIVIRQNFCVYENQKH